jgi:hypothetical protein
MPKRWANRYTEAEYDAAQKKRAEDFRTKPEACDRVYRRKGSNKRTIHCDDAWKSFLSRGGLMYKGKAGLIQAKKDYVTSGCKAHAEKEAAFYKKYHGSPHFRRLVCDSKTAGITKPKRKTKRRARVSSGMAKDSAFMKRAKLLYWGANNPQRKGQKRIPMGTYANKGWNAARKAAKK